MTLNPRVRQFFQASASIVVLLAAWQIASLFFPHYLFPPVQDVLARTVKILVQLAGAVAGSRNRRADFRRARRRVHSWAR